MTGVLGESGPGAGYPKGGEVVLRFPRRPGENAARRPVPGSPERRFPMRPRWFVGLLLLGCVAVLGCQTWVGGLTVPSDKKEAGPLANELAYQERVWALPAAPSQAQQPGEDDNLPKRQPRPATLVAAGDMYTRAGMA